jgi:polygalacturonase
VLVDGITVDSPALDRNNDGIDIDGSRRVRVVNSFFNTGDDAICLKASYRDCEDIVISNNVISSLVNGIKMGTASNGGFKNIAISNIVMRTLGAAGIALQIVDGGHMDGITVNNIVMHEVGAAIFIRLGDRGRAWMRPEHHAVGSLRNVHISNVIAQIYTQWDGRPLGSSISGLPGHPVENVTLSNIRIITLREQSRDATKGLGEAAIPENPLDYPEYSMFGSLPAYGLYVRHVRGLTLENVVTDFRTTDHRSALVCDRVENLRIVGWQSRTLPESDPVIRLRDVRTADLVGLSAGPGTPVFLRIDGASEDVVLQGSDLSRAAEPVVFGPGIAPSVLRR